MMLLAWCVCAKMKNARSYYAERAYALPDRGIRDFDLLRRFFILDFAINLSSIYLSASYDRRPESEQPCRKAQKGSLQLSITGTNWILCDLNGKRAAKQKRKTFVELELCCETFSLTVSFFLSFFHS